MLLGSNRTLNRFSGLYDRVITFVCQFLIEPFRDEFITVEYKTQKNAPVLAFKNLPHLGHR